MRFSTLNRWSLGGSRTTADCSRNILHILITGSEITYWTDQSASSGCPAEVSVQRNHISTCSCLFPSLVLGLRFVCPLCGLQTETGALCPLHETVAARCLKHYKMFISSHLPALTSGWDVSMNNFLLEVCFMTSGLWLSVCQFWYIHASPWYLWLICSQKSESALQSQCV